MRKSIFQSKEGNNKLLSKRSLSGPHHHSDKMPDDMYQGDAFWENYEYMLNSVSQYTEQGQFVVCHHPGVNASIIEYFGLEKQKDYVNKWNIDEVVRTENDTFAEKRHVFVHK